MACIFARLRVPDHFRLTRPAAADLVAAPCRAEEAAASGFQEGDELLLPQFEEHAHTFKEQWYEASSTGKVGESAPPADWADVPQHYDGLCLHVVSTA